MVKAERANVTNTFNLDTAEMLTKIKDTIESSVLSQLTDERRKMAEVTRLFDEKIATIQALRNQGGAKPYGTI